MTLAAMERIREGFWREQDKLGGRSSYPSKKNGDIHQGFGDMEGETDLREM